MTKWPTILCLLAIAGVAVALAQYTPTASRKVSLDEFYSAGVTHIDNGLNLEIEGKITDLTVNAVKREFGKTPKIELVNLNSPGGDLDAGIALGRLLRENRATTQVWSLGQCASSCVFALAGGVTRGVVGKVGIHRPYLTNTSLTEDGVRKATTQMEEKIRTYFREMNIPQRLADDMMATPSDQIKWLTVQELVNYGLFGPDPVIAEARILASAKKHGISRTEFQRRCQELTGRKSLTTEQLLLTFECAGWW
jgi:ATP-dependent protease ClpP protease subunit